MKNVSASRLPGLRTLLAALLIPALGAAVGAAAFAYENGHQHWRPQTTRTATGWRIVEPGGRRPSDPAVGGDQLVWTWGADTILMDLASGKTRLLGAGAPSTGALPVSVSDRYVVFSEGERDGSTTGYFYDISSGRRSRLPGDVQVHYGMTLSGDSALWIADRSVTSEIRAYDLVTRRESVVATGDISYPLLADGTLVAWSSPPTFSPEGIATPSPLIVKDTASATVTTVSPPPSDPNNSATPTGWIALRDGKLLGLVTTPGQAGATVLVRDIETSATQTMGTAEPGTLPAMDADTVVWIERDAGLFGATRIVGRHLDGSQPFQIAQVNGAVSAVSVDSGWVAWTTHGIAKSWIETARLPE